MPFNSIRQLPASDNKENAWKNQVARSINNNNVIAGSGVTIDNGPYGSQISFVAQPEKFPVVFSGEYDILAEYYPNQIVTVTQETINVDIYAQTIPFGNTSDESFAGIIPMCPGTYICVNYVPPAATDEYYLNTYLRPQFPSGIPLEIVSSTRFVDYNVYYPIYPTIPNEYTSSIVTPSGYGIIANQTFWAPLAPTIKQVLCKNGTQLDVFVYAQLPSGSFLDMYLPY